MKQTIIEIKKPCLENPDNMLPDEKGKFCRVCQTSVIDFTQKTPEEISLHLMQNHTQRGCGIFNSEQVKTHSWQDRFISSLQTRKLNYLAFVFTGILLLTGCRTRRTMGAYSLAPKKQEKHQAVTIKTNTDDSSVFG